MSKCFLHNQCIMLQKIIEYVGDQKILGGKKTQKNSGFYNLKKFITIC